MDGELSVNITVIIKEETLFTGILHLCLHLFFSSCHFPNSFSPWQTISLRSSTATKAFSVSEEPLSHTGHNTAVLLETFRPVGVFSGDELLCYSCDPTREGFQRRCLLYTGQMLYWAQGKLWMSSFCSFLTHLHTHTPLQENTSVNGSCSHTQLVCF